MYMPIYKFQVNVEIVDTLTGEYKTYRHREGTSVRTILLVQRTTVFVYVDAPQTRHTSAGEHYYGTIYLNPDKRDHSQPPVLGDRGPSLVLVRSNRDHAQAIIMTRSYMLRKSKHTGCTNKQPPH